MTGHNDDGKSCIVYDGPPSVVNQGLAEIWHEHQLPADNGPTLEELELATPTLEPSAVALEPVELHGTLCRWFVIRRKSPWAAILPSKLYYRFMDAQYARSFAKMRASETRGNISRFPGMHKTQSLDYIIVVKGTGRLILETGEAILRPGDVVVQRGSDHAWANDSYFRPFVAVAVLQPANSMVGKSIRPATAVPRSSNDFFEDKVMPTLLKLFLPKSSGEPQAINCERDDVAPCTVRVQKVPTVEEQLHWVPGTRQTGSSNSDNIQVSTCEL